MIEEWTAVGAMKRELRPEQRKHLDSMLWFLEDQYLGEGRSFVMSLAFVELALKRADHWITVFDTERTFVTGERIADSFLMETIKSRLERHHLLDHFEFKQNQFRYITQRTKQAVPGGKFPEKL